MQITNNNIVNALITALFTIGMIDLIYAVSLRREFQEEMSQEIYKAFNKERDILKKFTKEAIGEFIHANLQVRLGDEKGDVLYREAVKPYIDSSEEIFRTKFEYDINLSELDSDMSCSNGNGCGVTFTKADYYRITEELKFSKKIDLGNQNNNILTLIIAFDDLGLLPYSPPSEHSKNCIYREILKARQNEIKECKNKWGNGCIGKIGDSKPINFKIKVNGTDLEIKPSFVVSDNVFKIICDYNKVRLEVDHQTDFVIEVQSIHAKEINYYSAYIFEPSYNPEVHFGWSNSTIKEVIPIAFYTGKNAGDLEITPTSPSSFKYIKVKPKNEEWVFPRSGVVFIWRN